MSFSAKLYETDREDVRARRHRTRIEATASPAAETPHYVVVHNLSADGILVESHGKLQQNAIVVFDIPELGRLPARVAWHGDTFYGCAFLVPIKQSEIDAKLANAKVVWADFAGRASSTNAESGSVTQFPTQRALYAQPQDLQEFAAQMATPVLPDPEGRWAAGARFAFIIAAAAMLWAVIGGLVYLIV